MALKDLEIKQEYRSFRDNIVRDFYIPILQEAISYKRSVGFFSSSALSEISKGVKALISNGGTIELVASPYLSEEDVDAIRKGYAHRDEIVKKVVLNSLKESDNYFEKERLNILANLIADSKLDIKIAITNDNNTCGMYHEKMGIFVDTAGNKIAFSGSMNESSNAFHSNYESIDVFCNWVSQEENERVKFKETAFTKIWNNNEKNIITIDFPELKDEIITRYKTHRPNYNIVIEEDDQQEKLDKKYQAINGYPAIPSDIELRDYQSLAINNWVVAGFKGIFDMATGTGKTITGLAAVTELSNKLNHKLAVIIVCPYQHLVEQWVWDIEKFNMRPIIGYSTSGQTDWKKRLENAIRDQKLCVRHKDFFCFICTNATFSSAFVQDQIRKIKENILLMVDEAHNFGASHLNKLLFERYDYRLALSATIERFRDEEGTSKLYDFFGQKCIEYTLDEAIENNKLTKYMYHPIICTLDGEELEKYIDLTNEIKTCISKDRFGKIKLNERGKRLALERARLVAGAVDKITKLEENIQPYIRASHILVYCGATRAYDPNEEVSSIDEYEKRQIDVVTNLLGNKLDMKVSQFTSREDIKEREILNAEFANGDNLQILIAIKCLDEGVNIPAINTAFILASTSNPKEYIQRRGRVLRLYPGKDYATIYDFITLPLSLDKVPGLTQEQLQRISGLVKNELRRASEFSKISLNKFESENILDKIKSAYYINDYKIDLEDDFYYGE
jgi:superfamily II DNA or RNA helicase